MIPGGMAHRWRWRLLATVLAGIPLAADAVAAPAPMSDRQLWGVTAGAVAAPTAAAAGALDDPLRPSPFVGNGGTATATAPDGDSLAAGRQPREGVAVGGAGAQMVGHAEVALSQSAQAGARAMTLANLAAGDAANVANILDAGPPTGMGLPAAVAQDNTVIQNHRVEAGVGRAQAGGTFSRAENVRRQESLSENTHFTQAVTDRYAQNSTTRTVAAVTVPGFSPFGDFSVTLETPRNIGFTLPGFEIDGTVGDEPFRFGVAASVGDTAFTIPSVNFGTVSFRGDDVVISPGSLTLPKFKFSGLTGTVCFFECASGEVIPAFEAGGATASLPIPELTFAGANPFKDFDLQVGQGIAAAGTGSFSLGGLDASLTASFGLSIPDINGTIGFTVPGLSDGDPVDVSVDVNIPMPDVSIDVTAFDFDGPRITGSMTDGVLCMTIPAVGSCGTLELTRHETTLAANNSYYEEHASATHSQSFDMTALSMQTGAADLRDGEAQLLAMSESSLSADTVSRVALAGGAQSGYRIMNGVNGASALIGNALNLSAHRRPAGLTLGQTNSFLQIR